MISLHTGHHLAMSARELAAHLFEWDHIAFALITIAVGRWCYLAGRRAQARAVPIRKDQRP